MTENRLEGKMCFVTGITSGIGKVTARELANKDATVVLVKGECVERTSFQTRGQARRAIAGGCGVLLQPGSATFLVIVI